MVLAFQEHQVPLVDLVPMVYLEPPDLRELLEHPDYLVPLV